MKNFFNILQLWEVQEAIMVVEEAILNKEKLIMGPAHWTVLAKA